MRYWKGKRNTILDEVWKNSAVSKESSKGKLCGELPTNNLSFANVEITGIIFKDMYCFMENENLLPEEQKGCRRKSRGMKDQLLIWRG